MKQEGIAFFYDFISYLLLAILALTLIFSFYYLLFVETR